MPTRPHFTGRGKRTYLLVIQEGEPFLDIRRWIVDYHIRTILSAGFGDSEGGAGGATVQWIILQSCLHVSHAHLLFLVPWHDPQVMKSTSRLRTYYSSFILPHSRTVSLLSLALCPALHLGTCSQHLSTHGTVGEARCLTFPNRPDRSD
jgi:hypothetical protein